ncbi:MAG: hypothetical protein ABI672_00620 [Vicinamibacteria bacterium]
MRLPLWVVLALVALVGGVAFWGGQRQGRASAQNPAPAPSVVATPLPQPSALASVRSASDIAPSESGSTWALYRSNDRVSNHLIVGASFTNINGVQLMSLLCNGQDAGLAVHRSLLPASDGVSADAKQVASSIAIARRVFDRDPRKVELTFGDASSVEVDVFPENFIEFARRVALAPKVRTVTDNFDTTGWSEVIERVLGECGLTGQTQATPAPTPSAKPEPARKARRSPKKRK